MPGDWQGSQRRTELPPDWNSRIRPFVLERDGQQCAIYEDGVRCIHRATDVDHIDDKNDHDPANLRAICDWHHKKRSSAQGNAARKRIPERRKPEPHPGLITRTDKR